MAGVMIDDVDVLLFDEPLPTLDPATGKKAIDPIEQNQQDHRKTVLIIEHRLEGCPVPGCGSDCCGGRRAHCRRYDAG